MVYGCGRLKRAQHARKLQTEVFCLRAAAVGMAMAAAAAAENAAPDGAALDARPLWMRLLLTAALLLLAAGCALTAKEMKTAARRDEKRRNADGSEDRAACGF